MRGVTLEPSEWAHRQEKRFGSSSMAIKFDAAAKRGKMHTTESRRPCQDHGEVTESLLPSCCPVRGTVREANVVSFLGKAINYREVMVTSFFGRDFLKLNILLFSLRRTLQ